MNQTFGFERLAVWQDARVLATGLYFIVSGFPKQAQFGIGSQINKSAVSVASNIAEGVSRRSNKDQAHFTQIAYGSLMELLCQIIIAHDVKILDDADFEKNSASIAEIANKLSALRKRQLERNVY